MLTILVAVTCIALTWKFQVDSLFTELSGEPWLAMWVYPCAIAALIPLVFIALHLLVAFVQTIIFTVLPASYLGLATAEEH